MALTRPNYNNLNTNVEIINDTITVLHGNATVANSDIGLLMNRAGGLVPNAAFYWNETTQSFVTALTTSTGAPYANVTLSSYANVLTGNVSAYSITPLPGSGNVNVNTNLVITGNLTPTANNFYNIGTIQNQWHSIYVGPGTIYINGKPVLQDNSGTITVSTTAGQNLQLATSGGGVVQLNGNADGAGGYVAIQSTLQIGSIAQITSSDGNAIKFGNEIAVDNIIAKDPNNNLYLNQNGSGSVEVSGPFIVTGATTQQGALSVTNNTASTNTNSGALVVSGGVGVVGAIYAGSVYTNSFNFANGAAFVTTTIANTSEITANLSSGQNVGLNLAPTGVTAGNYGSATSIPTVVVDSKGRITSITSNAVSTTINLSGTSGTGNVAGGGTLNFAGSNGFTVTVSGNTITLSDPLWTQANANAASQQTAINSLYTNANANTAAYLSTNSLTIGVAGGNTTVGGNLAVSGNLFVQGLLTYVNTETINTTEYVNTINATNVYATTVGNTGTTLTGTLSTAAQPNITSVGTLAALSITNVGDVSANIGTIFTRHNSLDANVGAYEIYANVNAASQQTAINSLYTNANANTAAYLTTATGNISANYITTTGNIYVGTNLVSATGNVTTFKSIAVSGQSTVTAANLTSTLTVAAGSGIAIATDAGNSVITLSTVSTLGPFGAQNDFGSVTSDPVTISEDEGSVVTIPATIFYDLGSILSASGLIYPSQLILPTYSNVTLPSANPAGGFIYLSASSIGPMTAFSDGTNWRFTSTGNIVS